jgi:hypothetical protein
MKGVFWNSRGLADLAKHRYLADLVKEEQINFIALSETGRDMSSKIFVEEMIFFGTPWHHTADPGVFCLVWT